MCTTVPREDSKSELTHFKTRSSVVMPVWRALAWPGYSFGRRSWSFLSASFHSRPSCSGSAGRFAFGSSVSICPCSYGSSLCSPVVYLDVLLPSGEQGLLISSIFRLFEHQGGHSDLAVLLGSTYIFFATSKKGVRSPCTFVLRGVCYDGGMNGGAGKGKKRSKENGVSVRGWGE